MHPTVESEPVRRPPGITALSAFFLVGCLVSLLTGLALLRPGGSPDLMWRLNPDAHEAFKTMGSGAPLLMIAVSVTCGAAAVGLWTLRPWGRQLALGLLAVNLVGEAASALLRRDPRTLISLPIDGTLVAYLVSAKVRGLFRARVSRAQPPM